MKHLAPTLLAALALTAAACGNASSPTPPASSDPHAGHDHAGHDHAGHSHAGETAAPTPAIDPADVDPAAALAGYDALLRAHVDAQGMVDYAALAAAPQALSAYVASLSLPAALPGADAPGTPDARLAALMNAYNAFTLQLILDHYDGGKLASITDLHGGKPWDQKLWNLAGQTVSLNQIEHEMIREEFSTEPRIHWAVVCAARSCPPLRAEAYDASNLEIQLADQERRVLLAGDERFIQTDGDSVAAVTKLFEWYGGDFGADWKPYVARRVQKTVASPEFIDYNWELNTQ